MISNINGMKTNLILLLLPWILPMISLAGIVPKEIAQKAAINFYKERQALYYVPGLPKTLSIAGCHEEQRNGEPVYYVFSLDPQGFIVVSAEDRFMPVIGYSFEHPFGISGQPDNVRYWMGSYADQVVFIREQNAAQRPMVRDEWDYYLRDEVVPRRSFSGSVAPLLTTRWNQNFPYNYYCPEDPAGPGGFALAGCVATACAQISYYYRWPDHGLGYHCYMPVLHPEYGEQCVDFENTWYRYDEMVDQPSMLNSAIAEYIYHAGVSMDMDYDPNGSAPSNFDSMSYFTRMLPYEGFYRDSIGDSVWIVMLKSDLESRQPVFYSGNPLTGAGHAFVCDGYQDSVYFHFNLGWGGLNNGYYLIDNIYGFNYEQMVVRPSFPDTLNNIYPFQIPPGDTLTSLEGSFTDGSGPMYDYPSNTSLAWLISPQTEDDSVTFIEISFARFHTYDVGDKLVIHDGPTVADPVLIEVYGDTLPPKVNSSGNKVLVEFSSDGANTGPGFLLNYLAHEPDFCTGITEVTDSNARISDGSGNFHYQSNAVCKWRLIPTGCDSSLTLHFLSFDTEQDQDYLSIYDMETQELLAKYSGRYTDPPPSVTAPSGKMFLVFTSDFTGTAQGWEAWYGNMLGIGTSSNYPVSLKVFPSPAAYSITIETSHPSQLSILNISGQQLITRQIKEAKTVVDISTLPSGVYVVKVVGEKGVQVGKFTKW
jgi:hypothetical protein